VIHKKNAGKRKAVGTGFATSRGKYIVFIDSDSIVHQNAIEQFVKTFNSDKQIGAVVGNAKAWNSKTNLLTKLQAVYTIFNSTYTKFVKAHLVLSFAVRAAYVPIDARR
jgi:hyaluronan synthase